MRLRPSVTLVLLAAAGVARAANLNAISEVAVRDEGGSIVLTIKGSRPPNFTTFSMADPPRFVIDLSEARFQGVPEDVIVQDGVVNVVKNLSYGSDATSIARVMLAFAVDVDPPEVQTQGTSLVVRVARPAGASAPVAQKDDAAAKAAEAARAEAEKKAQAEAARAEAEKKAQEEAARAEAEKKAQEEAARAEAEKKKAAEDAARAEAAKKPSDGGASAEAEQQKAQQDAARADAERKAREEEDLRKAREAYEQERQAAVAKAEAEKAGKAESERIAKAEAEKTARAEPREEPRQAEPQAPAAAPQAIAEAPVAAEPTPPAAEAATPVATDRLAAAPSARVREIGFQQLPAATRVFVRTSVTPRFTIQEIGENTIRVALENTRATRRNDLRFLDTSFFRSAVAMVTPKKVGSGYVVDIRLKERVPFQQKIEGDMLAIDFERPAAAAAADPAVTERAPAAAEAAPAAEAVPAALDGAAPAPVPAAR